MTQHKRTTKRTQAKRRAARRHNLRVVAFTLWGIVLLVSGFMLGSATGPQAHAAFRPQASALQGGVVGASRSGTTCRYRDRHARVLCVDRAPARVCREVFGHPTCWWFTGSDTQVLWDWAGHSETS
jgi:hypothetical protein